MGKKRTIIAQVGKVKDLDRSFDIMFWQQQGPEAIFRAAWELVVQHAKLKGIDESQLRFQRSIGGVYPQPFRE